MTPAHPLDVHKRFREIVRRVTDRTDRELERLTRPERRRPKPYSWRAAGREIYDQRGRDAWR